MIARVVIALGVFAMTACTARDDNDNVTASINLSGDNLNGSAVAITGDSDTGKMSLNVPGLEAKINLPAGVINKSNFDIDGVKLYPGSSVTGVNVDANNDTGSVRIAFDAPATPAIVTAWFAKAFADQGMTVTASDTGLAGSDKDGSPFAIALAPKGDTATAGTIMMRDKDSR